MNTHSTHHTLTLISNGSLQAVMLQTTLERALGQTCHIIDYQAVTQNPLSQGKHLFLLDCGIFSAQQLQELLNRLSSITTSFIAALINYSNNEQINQLVLWPQIKGVFHEGSNEDLLTRGLNEIQNGGHWMPRHLMSPILEQCRKPPEGLPDTSQLTRRESQILNYLADGLTNQQIADTAHISEHTVKSHLYNIFRKLDVTNRLQACNLVKRQLR